MADTSTREATLGHALFPVIFLVLSIGATVALFGQSAHVPLILSTGVACAVAVRLGYTWKQLEVGMVKGVTLGLQACLVLMIIGILIGTWILSGIVPTMVYYGLDLMAPSIFLVSTCIICALVALATGSSWSTAGTVGLALIGIGEAMGMSTAMVAGAIISGAYFGDKMSPLSDTTNLAPGTVGTDLFTHIRHMIYTTGPSLVIALIIYTIIGLTQTHGEVDSANIVAIQETLGGAFTITPWLLVPPLLVVVMVVFRIPALPALLGGAVLGALVALLAQGASMQDTLKAATAGYAGTTGVAQVDELLNRGGLFGMMETVALIFFALAFGGVMERSGLLGKIAESALRNASTPGRLVVTTILTCIGFNVVAGDQYIAIVVPGRMYRSAYLRQGLHPKNLSRALEDSGTLTSPLIPWNTCGAFMSSTLGVSAAAYFPFAFVNLLNPLVSILYGMTGWTMAPLDEESSEEDGPLAPAASPPAEDQA